ncbi:MAG: hypothetical protein ACRCVN_06225 [Spirochaetia bacterium]
MKRIFFFMLIFSCGTISSQANTSRCDAISSFAKRFGESQSTIWGNILTLMHCGANEQDIYIAMKAFLDQYEKNAFWIREKRQGGYNGLTAPDLISGFLTILHDMGKPRSYYRGEIFFGPHVAVAKRVAPALHKNWDYTSRLVFADLSQLRKQVRSCKKN